MVAWHVDLPQKPLANGFTERQPQLALRTQMDVGPAKVRRRQTAGVVQMACPFRLTTAQRATLVTFWQTTLAGGSLPFTWTHPVTGAAINCRIVEPPEFQPAARGIYWITTLLIEILPG